MSVVIISVLALCYTLRISGFIIQMNLIFQLLLQDTLRILPHKIGYENISCGKVSVDALPFSAETPVARRRKHIVKDWEPIKFHSLFTEYASTMTLVK